MKFLVRMLILAVVIFLVARLGLLRADYLGAAKAGVLLAFVNAFVKPVLKLIALPLTIMTLGLFSLVLNVVLFYAVVGVVSGVEIVGFVQTVVAAFVVSIATAILTRVAGL